MLTFIISLLESELAIITARKRSLGQGNIFTPVLFTGGGVRGFIRGWGVRGFIRGGHAWFYSRHAWFYSGGGMRGFFSFFGYNEIRSKSGWYASYWNAFLFGVLLHFILYFNAIQLVYIYYCRS